MSNAQEAQDAVEHVADLLGRSILIEDAEQQPVWWSTRGPVDPTRVKSILHREVAPLAAAVVQRFRLDRAVEPVRTPAMPDLEMWSRWCIPVRHEGHFVGLMWILDPDETLSRQELQPAIDCASLAASILDGSRQSAEQQRRLRDELIARLRLAPDEDVARELARLQRISHDATVQAQAPARPGGWPLPDDMSLHVVGERHDRVATSGAPLPLANLGEAIRRADATRRVIAAGGRPDPETWDGLGAWRLVVDAPDCVTPESVHPAAAVLIGDSRADLMTTARAMVDYGGDVAAAAQQLHVHRTTLYYRLERLKALTGVDLFDGPSRTHLQLALWLAAYRATA